MKILFGRSLVVCVLLGATSFVFAGGFKSRIITSSPLTITVPDDHFLRVRNFTQQGGVDRGVVTVTLNDQSTNVLTASRIDTSSLSTSPETMNQVVIAGPASHCCPYCDCYPYGYPVRPANKQARAVAASPA